MKKIKIFYKNRLPHIAPIGATFFVTFRLTDSLPQHMLRALELERKQAIEHILKENPKDIEALILHQKKFFFKKLDFQLDHKKYGECFLKNPAIAQIVKDKLHELDQQLYDLVAYRIMPNHVHILIDTAFQIRNDPVYIRTGVPKNYVQLDNIMQLIKGSTAYYANQVLNRRGTFWLKDSYDHYTRSGREFGNIVNYIVQNPVKARLVREWKAFPHSFVNEEYFEAGYWGFPKIRE